MGKLKYDMATKEQWFEKYYKERMSVANIAKEANCDARTVKTGIEQIMTESNATTAEIELIRSAISMHQADLSETIKKIKNIILIRDIKNAPIEWAEDDKLEEIILDRMAEVDEEQKAPLNEMLGSEYQVKLRLLGQHLNDEPLWRSFAAWKRAYYKYVKAGLATQVLLVRLLKKDFKLKQSRTYEPYVITKTICPLYYAAAAAMVISKSEKGLLEIYFNADDGSERIVYYGEKIAEVTKDASHYGDLLYKGWTDFISSKEIIGLGEAYNILAQASEKTGRAAEELLLSHYIPGRCRACKRYRK
ncbi:hypothetical protein ACFLVK_01990 [Chloroflexota bacterium]